MTVEIVTYANKSQGMFEELVNNKFDVPIKVLGWGTKWNGFSDKYKGVYKYLENKSDDDIVIFIDGFDTKINRNPHNVVELFKECGSGDFHHMSAKLFQQKQVYIFFLIAVRSCLLFIVPLV
mgnify:CR=1 FL=1